MAFCMDGTALTRHVQGARIDPESLEQENDQGIEALSERTKLLRQVGAAIWHLLDLCFRALYCSPRPACWPRFAACGWKL